MNAQEREFTNVTENMDQVDHLEQAVAEHGQYWMREADQWVRRNPYLAIGAAVLIGCVIASCLRRDD